MERGRILLLSPYICIGRILGLSKYCGGGNYFYKESIICQGSEVKGQGKRGGGQFYNNNNQPSE